MYSCRAECSVDIELFLTTAKGNGLVIFGYSFFILPHLDVWQKTKNPQG